MGSKGTELKEFIKEQQELEREERNRLREEQERQRESEKEQREHDRIHHDKLDKFRLAQMEREKEKEQREREEQKEQREREKEREQSEKEQRDYQREKDEKDREFEIERMKFERDKMDFESKMKTTDTKKASSDISEDGEGEDNKEVSIASGHTHQRIGVKGPKMPCLDDRSDDMDSFLHRFEVHAESQGWNKGQLAVYLSALSTGKALEVYSRLPVKDAQDYEILKDALPKRFNLTEEGFKQKFKSATAEVGEAPLSLLPGWRII